MPRVLGSPPALAFPGTDGHANSVPWFQGKSVDVGVDRDDEQSLAAVFLSVEPTLFVGSTVSFPFLLTVYSILVSISNRKLNAMSRCQSDVPGATDNMSRESTDSNTTPLQNISPGDDPL